MATRRALTGAAPGTTAAPGTRSPTDAALTPEKIAAAEHTLTVYVGPIAKVLVRKAAAQTSSSERFYLLLAENLSETERRRFLTEVDPSALRSR
jgi:serine/threonine-protein kinase